MKKSPFPGMDPYLEQHWRDVHHRLVTYSCDQMQASLPGDLLARMEERVFVESAGGVERSVYPDVRVTEHGRPGWLAPPAGFEQGNGGIAIAEPLVIQLDDEPVSEGYIEIIDVGSGNRVITVIEVLSLANKLAGEGQDLYLKDQCERKDARLSLVEIDLLRAGKRILLVPPDRVPPRYRTTYQVVSFRAWKPFAYEVYRVPLRERLPVISIPLRETDRDVSLDLQALIDQCYRNGRYDTLDYSRPASPPLEAEDQGWADELFRKC